MAFDLGIGGGKTVRVSEPTRAQFTSNLGGAVSYSLATVVYKALEVMGGAVGAFIAGVGVQLLDRLEPSLVRYTAPLIDLILKQEGLDPDLRTFFAQLKAPTDAGAAAILTGLTSTAGGAVYGSFLDVLLSGVHQSLLRLIRPTIPDVASLMSMQRRGQVSAEYTQQMMSQLGYKDLFVNAYREITQLRAGLADWIEGLLRGNVSDAAFRAEAARQGVPNEVVNLLLSNRQPLLGFDDLLRGLYRGQVTQAQLLSVMSAQGWSQEDTLRRIAAAKPLPPLADVIRLAVREAWRDDVAAAWGYDQDYPGQVGEQVAKMGLDPDWGKRYWRAHWELPSLTYAIEMTHRGIISPGEFDTLLRTADYPAGWRGRMLQAIYSPLTRVDTRRMYGLGVLDRAGVKRAYKELGYDETNAERLAEFTVRYEDSKGQSKPEVAKELSVSILEEAYVKGLVSRDELVSRVTQLNYPQAETEIIARLADVERATALERIAAAARRAESAEHKTLSLSLSQQAYVTGVLPREELVRRVTEMGYPPTDVGVIVRAADGQRSAFLERLAAEDLEALSARARVLSTSQAQEGYVTGELTRADLVSRVVVHGYTPAEAELIAGITDVRRAAYTQAAEAEVTRAERDREQELSVGQVQAAYLAGTITRAELVQRVIALQYPQEEAEILAAIADARRVVVRTPDYSVEYRRDVKAIIERAYYKGTIDEGEATTYLTDAGLGLQEIGYALAANDLARTEAAHEAQLVAVRDAYQSRAITRTDVLQQLGRLDTTAAEQERLLSEWETPMVLPNRRLTESQYRTALTRGLIEPEDYQEALYGLGYAEVDIALLVAMAAPKAS